MATLFEWKIGKGYVWIADNPNKGGNDPADYTVYVDPANVSDWYFKLPDDVKHGTFSGDFLNRLFNSEVLIDDPIAVRIMAYWRFPWVSRDRPEGK